MHSRDNACEWIIGKQALLKNNLCARIAIAAEHAQPRNVTRQPNWAGPVMASAKPVRGSRRTSRVPRSKGSEGLSPRKAVPT